MNWTEKYRPSSLREVIGNKRAKDKLLQWAREWQKGRPSKKAIILYGKAGVGKTSSAHALAKDFNWQIIELNASDERNKDIIEKIALTGAVNEAIGANGIYISSKEGARKLIVLDEADNLYEKAGDYGGKRAIVETIKATKQPIILIANDYSQLIKGSGQELKKLCLVVEFKKPKINEIISLLREICRKEGIKADMEVLYTIATRCDGDIRSAINDLQAVAYERRIGKEVIPYIGYRDREKEIFKALHKILKAKDMKTAIREARGIDESPENLILWIDENIPYEYRHLNDLKDAYEVLSKADIFLGRTWKRQYYGLWSYAQELMTGGVAVAKRHEYRNFVSYNFPAWLREMGKSKQFRQAKAQLAQKIGKKMHMSSKKAMEFLHELKPLFTGDTAIRLTAKLDLDQEEIYILVGEKAREIYEKAKELKKNEKQTLLFNFK